VAIPGEEICLDVVVTNHAEEAREVACQPVLPAEWDWQPRAQHTVIPPKAEGSLTWLFSVPSAARPGKWIIPVDVKYHGQRLGQFREAVIVIPE
jgi:hypothetical protein